MKELRTSYVEGGMFTSVNLANAKVANHGYPSRTASASRGSSVSGNNTSAAQSVRWSLLSAAEIAAAALREIARGWPSKRSSATSSISKKGFKPIGSAPIATLDAVYLSPHWRPRSRPLSTPVSSIWAQFIGSTGNLANGGPSEAKKFAEASAASQDEITRLIPPPRGSCEGLRDHAQARQQNSMATSQSQTPMSYRDLGRDYSRYPLLSPKGSFFMASTSAPQQNGRGEAPPVDVPFFCRSSEGAPLDAMTNVGYTIDPEKTKSWLLDDRIGAPDIAIAGYSFPLYLDEKESDDDFHMPRSDDDERLKPKIRDLFAPNRLLSLFGLLFMLVGLCCIFILLPVLGATGAYEYPYPYHSEGPRNDTSKAEPWAKVNSVKYSLLQNVRKGPIDPDTPRSAMTRKSFLGEDLALVFSDEFNIPNRTFYPGDDPFWTAPDLWYGATQDLEWYDPDAVTTAGGTLTLRMDQFENHGLYYRSGMINSWNQACFKGGVMELSVSLPGPGGASGLWPGAWTLGNLGRPGYRATTDGTWPFTYNSCDVGITPNQSMTDGTSYLLGQKLPSCTCPGEDHPTPNTGRGAPEIDVFEASADPKLKLGVITQSYQVAPYDIWYQPDYNYMAIPNYNTTQLNAYCGGPYQQAISGMTEINNGWYDGKLYQKYGFEYTPGTGADGQIAWFVGDDMSYMISGNAIGPNGNVNSRLISEEPMSIVVNFGISHAWTGIKFSELVFPATMYVDYIRWYQPVNRTSLTCDPPGYETTEYIKNHPKAYNNINLTNWDETGYGWPKHRLNSNC